MPTPMYGSECWLRSEMMIENGGPVGADRYWYSSLDWHQRGWRHGGGVMALRRWRALARLGVGDFTPFA